MANETRRHYITPPIGPMEGHRWEGFTASTGNVIIIFPDAMTADDAADAAEQLQSLAKRLVRWQAERAARAAISPLPHPQPEPTPND